MNSKFQISLFQTLVCLSLIGAIMAMWLNLSNARITEIDIDNVEVGMSKREVVELIGKPHKLEATSDTWLYQVWGCSDLLSITFDESETVETVSF